MKKILITGGAGFVGSHLCERLLNENNKVFCIDNCITGNKFNIIHLMKNSNFEFILHDVTNSYFMEVDEIYNLACPASPKHYQQNPIQTIKTSIMGAINALELAKNVKAKVMQASTSEIYGDPIIHPQKENYFGNVNPISIRSCYKEGKRCAETLFADYQRIEQIKIKIIRIFNTYGERMSYNDGRVVPNFIIQALQNKDITIYGDGLQTRSFQYINDLIDGMLKTMNTSDFFIEPVNIGNPQEITILELAKRIIRLTNSKSKIVFFPPLNDDPLQRCPDISLAKEELNWEPKTQLEDGLLYTIRYFKSL